MEASRIILAHGGNMVRASYNKAVDAHTLFLDAEGDSAALDAIPKTLLAMLGGDGWLLLPGHGAIIPRDQR